MQIGTEYSLLWWIVALSGAIVLVHWLYRGQAAIFGRRMYRLIRGLRLTALALLTFLLVHPYVIFQKAELQPKSLVWVVDHSRSMVLSQDSSEVRQLAKKIDNINSNLKGLFLADVIGFGQEVTEKPNFDFDHNRTDGYQWIRHLQQTRARDEIAAVVLVTDGIFNTSYSPEFFVSGLRVPVFVVGTGDTAVVPDAGVYSVIHPRKVLPNTTFEIEVIAKATFLTGKNLELTVSGQGVVTNRAAFSPAEDIATKSAKFKIKADKAGIHKYTVSITAVPGERNLKNNSFTFYVEVTEDRKKVLLIDEIKHPDIGILKEYVLRHSEHDLKIVAPDSLKYFSDEPDFAIVHSPAHPETFAYLKRKASVPLLIIAGYGADTRALATLTGLEFTRFARPDKAFPAINDKFYKVEQSFFTASSATGMPPIDVFYGITGANEDEIMNFQKINGVSTSRPLTLLRESGRRIVLFNGEGLWKWRNHRMAESDTMGMVNLWMPLMRWLTSGENQRPFEVIIPGRAYSGDLITAKAYLTDEASLPVSGAQVSIAFRDTAGRTFSYDFSPESGYYSTAIKDLNPGVYNWTAQAVKASAKWNDRGFIIIQEYDVETSEITADHPRLRQIAQNTDGEFFTLNQLDQLEASLRARDFAPRLITRTEKFQLIEWWPYFILIFLLLAAEWFLRRYLGSY